jgi:hypothetical protein
MSDRAEKSMGHTRQSSGGRRYGRLILACLIPLVLAACYEVGEEIIDAATAEEVATLPGRYSLGEGAFTIISDQPETNDYRDDFYLAQIMPDDGGIFAAFFQHPESWSMIPLRTTPEVFDLASQFNVEIVTDMADILIGSRHDILAFLSAHGAEHLTAE